MRTLCFDGMGGHGDFDTVHEIARVRKETTTLGIERTWPSYRIEMSVSAKDCSR